MPENTPKKRGFLKIIAIVVLVLVIVIIAIPFLIDANQFRPQIQSKLTGALGRDVKVGNLKLSLLSGSLTVNDISIADNPEFSHSPFVTAKSLKVSVEMKPLIFSKEVRVIGISLEQPAINLVRSAAGNWNFSDLGGKESPGKQSAGSSGLPETDILIKKLEITGGRVTSTEGHKKPVVYENVNLTASNLSFTTSFPFELSASLPGGGNFKLDGQAGPLNKTDMLKTPMKASVAVNDFNLVASGFVPPETGLSGLVDFSGTLASDGQQAYSKGFANAEKLQVMKGGSPASKPISLEYVLNYDLEKRKGDLSEAKVQCGKAAARMNGNFSMLAENININMKLLGNNMPVQDLTTLLPAFGVTLPKGASLQGGSMNADLTAQGPVDRLITEGSADIVNTRLVGFDLAGKMSALTTLAGIQPNQQTEIEKFATRMKMTPEGVQVSELQMLMPALGELSGTGKIGVDQSLDFKMRALLKPSGGVAGELSKLTGGNALNLPFFIRGTSSDPKFVPDTQNAAKSILGSVIPGQVGKSDTGNSVGDAIRGLFKKK
ncbi:MAG TPA: AsmA family protein [Acidobacteriota bacterium]|nr:AsmA family protein [Acidobacteriota bacterium]